MIYRFYHFLGGIIFALILISTTALFVIVGTFLESTTDSHRYAAQLTYGSSLFSLLLYGFFINILISALRRYPFKIRHIPFLITHLGMLMVLAGVLIKNHFGVQGTMTILEGSGSQQIALKDKHSLLVESKSERDSQYYSFNQNFSRYSLLNPLIDDDEAKRTDDELKITLLDYAPNSYETIESFIKGSYTSIFGLRPVPAHLLISPDDELPTPTPIHLPQSKESPWNLVALISDSPEIIAKKLYVSGVTIVIHKMFSGERIYDGALSTLLNENDTVITPFGKLSARLDFSWSMLKGFNNPTLYVDLTDAGQDNEDKVAISLAGEEALLNRNAFPFVGKGKMTIDLTTNPTLILIKDHQNDVHLFAFTKYGQVTCTRSPQGNLGNISAYDDGYLGYSLETKLQNVEKSLNRKMREFALLNAMRAERDDRSEKTKQISSELLLSGYLRAYGSDIDEFNIEEFNDIDMRIGDVPLVLESPLTVRHHAIPSSKKLEDNVPCVVLRFKKGGQEEIVSLRFDPNGNGFKWPVFNGEYIVRFQPLLQEIPYRLRLRQARQINYATSAQPFSYESDLIVTDSVRNDSVESQISMNNVHETWDGYRFYLSNISPADNGSLKRVQIVVNQDPAKYFLTYPGAFIMISGILLLFFRRTKSGRNK